MRATQIRITLGLVAAVLGLGAHAASADAVSPQGAFTAVSTKVTFKLGTATMTCTSSSMSGTVTSSGSGQPIIGTISSPIFSGCTVNASGFTFSATCTTNSTNGSWVLSMSSGGTASLTIPQGGMVCTTSILGQNCKCTSTPVGSPSATISGTWSNASSSATFTSQPVPVVTSGGFPCPSGTSKSMTATYLTTPVLTITAN